MIYAEQEILSFTQDNIPNVADDYDNSVTYTGGNIVKLNSYTYKAITSNIDKNPLFYIGVHWIEWDVANDYAMLDIFANTVTTFNGDGIVEFDRGTKDILAIGNFNSTVITMEYLDENSVVLDSKVFTFGTGGNIVSEWSYMYGGFTTSVDRIIYTQIKRIGVTIKITFNSEWDINSYCGYLISGKSVYGGCTLSNVGLPDKRLNNETIKTSNFDTIIEKKLLIDTIDKAKRKIATPMLFIIDEDEDSSHGNLVILGKILKIDGVASYLSTNTISWDIEQSKKDY